MSNNRYKPILPAPNLPRPTSGRLPPTQTPLRPKRTSVRIACNGCRAKRTACDGERPSCTPCIRRGTQCVYLSATPAETPAMVMKREMELLRTRYKNLAEAFDILRDLPEDRSVAALRRSRLVGVGDTAALLASISQENANHDTLPRQVMLRPPPQDSPEFKLMLRHNIAYPTLLPLDAGAVSATSYFPVVGKPASEAAQRESSLSSSCQGSPMPSTSAESPSRRPSAASRVFDLEPHPSPADYCDARLQQLEIAYWTSAPISNALAASLISLYLKIDHPTLGLFDDDLFLDDLTQNRARYSSSLLVASILVWACHAYSTILPVLDSVSNIFLLEAKAAWAYEQAYDSLPTVAAAQLLHLAGIYNIYNGDPEAQMHMAVGSRMAERMGLFGLSRSQRPFPTGYDVVASDDDWLRAAAHTAWGAYNCVAMNGFMFQKCDPAIAFPPLLEVPGEYNDRRMDEAVSDGAPSHDLPGYMGRTFPTMCGFWSITSEWTLRYYLPTHEPVVGRVPWEFTLSMFRKLMAWTDGLHFKLARGDEIPHHGAILHIWLHAAISQLFRPFARTPGVRGLSLLDPEVASEFARSVFDASLHQLKHMLLGFQGTYGCSSYAIFWHMALLYVANAALEDVSDPQWRAYFNLCVTSYGELYGNFRVAEGIIRSLLTIALCKGMMGGAEAVAILERVMAPKSRVALPVAKLGSGAGGFVVDLNLAMTDRDGAQLVPLDELFDTLCLFNDFIETEATDEPLVSMGGAVPSALPDGV